MEKRKEQLLKFIVENYTRTAEPVGSKFLADNSGLEVSAPTVRNEMHDLEEAGFLTHPHTSAGRIPTGVGYKYYVDNIMQADGVSLKIKKEITDKFFETDDYIRNIKNVSKYLAEATNSAVIVSFERGSIYYTGMANLFSQPEFRDFAHVVNFSTIFDQVEDRIEEIYDLIDEDVKVLVGEENPLGRACSMIATKFGEGNLLTILAPMRINYKKSFSLIKHIQTLF